MAFKNNTLEWNVGHSLPKWVQSAFWIPQKAPREPDFRRQKSLADDTNGQSCEESQNRLPLGESGPLPLGPRKSVGGGLSRGGWYGDW